MENIFIILAIIASVIYKFYENYQKEMEKAAKRKQQQAPPVPPAPTNIPRPIPAPKSQQRPAPVPAPPPIQIPEIRKPIPRKPITPTPTLRTQPEIPTKLTQAHHLKIEREQNKGIEVMIVDDEGTPQNTALEIEFDLKTAIIQSAILERPYK